MPLGKQLKNPDSQNEMMLVMSSSGRLDTKEGEFTIAHFTDYCDEALVLYKGNIQGREALLCRLHDQCLTSEVFYAANCDCASQMRYAQKLIQQEGYGIIIYLYQQGRGNKIAPYIATIDLKARGVAQDKAFETLGFMPDKRSYDIAAKILKYFKIKSVRLLSDNRKKIYALESRGIKVTRLEHSGHIISIDRLKSYVDYFRTGQNLPLLNRNKGEKRMLILADLCLDYTMVSETNGNDILNTPKPVVGGTALNIALAVLNTGVIKPMIFGKTGDDAGGGRIRAELEKHGIVSFIETTKTKDTAFCIVIHARQNRILLKNDNIETSTNDYDLKNFLILKELDVINKDDFIFLAGHFLTRCDPDHSRKLLEIACSIQGKIIFDMVPHNMYKQIPLRFFKSVIKDSVYLLIGELNTFLGLMGKKPEDEPTAADIDAIVNCFKARFIDIRFGEANIAKHILIDCRGKKSNILVKENTGWADCPLELRNGFGDRLTAKILRKYFLSPKRMKL